MIETFAARSRRVAGSAFARAARGSTLTIAAGFLVLLLVAVIAPQLIAAGNPLEGNLADRLLPPSPQHVFGTDQLGRDVFTRVVHGARTSLATTLLAVAVGAIAGGAIGLVAGFFGDVTDAVLMRFVDVLLAIPSLLLSMAIITALGRGGLTVAIAVGLASVATFARVMRSAVFSVRTADYVEAASALGVRRLTILRRHILPNSFAPFAALAVLEVAQAVLAVSALGFLGYGAPPPAPEWGTLISDGRDFLASSWWLTTLPGLVVVATVLATNRLAHGAARRGDLR